MNSAVVLVTGALTGIARPTALAFSQERARIVVSGRHQDARLKLIAELRALDTEADFLAVDVCHEGDVRKLIDHTVSRFGRLDVAVNNPAIEGLPGSIIEQASDSYAAAFDTNVLGNRFDDIEKLRSKIRPEFGPWSVENHARLYHRTAFSFGITRRYERDI